MFAIPSPTPYDLKFRLLDVPVRVNPFFWAMSAVLGWTNHSPLEILIWVACVFVSIMVHEFGHALTARSLLRRRPSVLLYFMGGLCFYDDEDRRSLGKRAMVLIMGPGAGFLFAGFLLALGLGLLGFVDFWPLGYREVHPRPSWFNHLPELLNISVQAAYHDLLYINIFWGLMNLLPIYPLDGGQLAGVFFTMHDSRRGPMRGYALSMVAAGAIAIYLWTLGEQFNAFFVASLAFLNFQLFQAARYENGTLSQFGRDDDWWRK